MKIDTLKIFLVSMTLLMVISTTEAQFDDVYYDANQIDYGSQYDYSDSNAYGSNDGVTYYDNDAYAYYDDYDYYYTSRIRRFYRPYRGFGFYDPCYVSYNYYDPYAYNYYGYPSASIYLGFGFGSSWNNWNNWNNWGSYGGYGGYWGGNNGYCGGGYGNYYNNYNNYYNCTPIACYVPPVYYPVVPGGGSGANGVYYGPRVAGNTGVSPRVPATDGVVVQPGYKDSPKAIAQTKDQPGGQTDAELPGRVSTKPGTTKHTTPNATPSGQPITRDEAVAATGGQTPIDREIQRDNPSSPKRPVFKPDVKYQPYPTPDRTNPNAVDKPSSDRPSYKPYTPDTRSSAPATRDNNRPTPQADSPARVPSPNTPTRTSPNTRSNNDRPSYTPPPRASQNQSNPRSSNQNTRSNNSAPQRNNDRPSYTPPPRSNNQPSYSPPSGSSRQGNSSTGRSSSPNRSSSPSSSGSRSSGSSKSPTSPRGKG